MFLTIAFVILAVWFILFMIGIAGAYVHLLLLLAAIFMTLHFMREHKDTI